jgi:hypothetical protein
MQMSVMYAQLRQHARAAYWQKFAVSFRKRANAVSFNGRFYTHQVPLVPVHIDGVDPSVQLSLSNPMDINRGLATHAMAATIIDEYQIRGKKAGTFAPWYSIDPPFPDGIYGDEKLVGGAYCNGGIMPLVGGELARAALEHGFELYGVEQLLRYEELSAGNESYLWYFPDGRHATKETSTSPEAYPTDGWGASAMLYALVEGLAGVVDLGTQFRTIRLAPRWIVTGRDEVRLSLVYGASGAVLEYSYVHDAAARTVTLEVEGDTAIDLHLMIPTGTRAGKVTCNGRTVRATTEKVRESSYANAALRVRGKAVIQVHYS